MQPTIFHASDVQLANAAVGDYVVRRVVQSDRDMLYVAVLSRDGFFVRYLAQCEAVEDVVWYGAPVLDERLCRKLFPKLAKLTYREG